MILVDHQFYSEGGNYYLPDSCNRGYVASFSLLSSFKKEGEFFLMILLTFEPTLLFPRNPKIYKSTAG
jgi:hypothetical protein